MASVGWGLAAQGVAMGSMDSQFDGASSIEIDPSVRFELSPYLYMQFMEPLGTTDGSVAAAWDHLHNRWREGFIEVSKELAPTLMRWGGCFSSYYRKDPARTWAALMDAYQPHEAKIRAMREQAAGTGIPLALTECHFALPGPNRNSVLSSWAAGVAMARLLNVHTRNGDVLKIATAADFCGTRWQNNAIMLDGAKAYMQPVARVMSLYRHHVGQQALEVVRTPPELDVTASRTGNKIFLHVINTHRMRSVQAQVALAGLSIRSGSVFEIAVDPDFEVWSETRDVIAPKRKDFPAAGSWDFPPASVSALELEV
jgi:alpha-N-arabinofuranosidase